VRIALVQSHLTRHGFWGGVLLARQIAAGLAAAGHEVHAVEFSHTPAKEPTPIAGFVVHELPAMPMDDGINPLWAWSPFAADVAEATRFLRAVSPDVVYGHMIQGNTAVSAAALDAGLPVVHHVHDFAFLCGRSFLVDAAGRPCAGPDAGRCEACLRARATPAMRAGMQLASLPGGDLLLRTALGRRRSERFRLREGLTRFQGFSKRYLDGVGTWIATGPAIRDVLLRHGVARERVTILPHALPDERRRTHPGPPPLSGRPLRIGYFGRIAPEKGVDLLADVLGRLARRGVRDFEWWVVSGSVPATVRADLARRSGLPEERIRLVEGLQGSDLDPVIASLDVCVIPSLWPEIGPLTLLEALSQGVPCVCNDMAGHAHLVRDGVNGFLFRTGDGADLEEKLSLLLADDALAKRLRGTVPPLADFASFLGRIDGILRAAALPSPPSP